MMHKYHITLPLAILAILFGDCSASGENSIKLFDQIRSIDNCVAKMMYSFSNKSIYPKATTDGLREACKTQAEAVKCVKEKSKELPAILKRAMAVVTQNRQRYIKKYCTNVESELSKQLVADFKCNMEKRLESFDKPETIYSHTMFELLKMNFNNTALELKHICCAIMTFKRDLINGVGSECASSKPRIEELISSQIPSDLSLLCDDEEKMFANVCPKLEPVKIPSSKFDYEKSVGPSITTLYLVATLGEPDDNLVAKLKNSGL